MRFTGERFVPSVSGDIELEHSHRYLLASEFVADKVVLDIASGEGYGSALLARHARQVTGVDIDPDAVAHASDKYKADNLSYLCGDCTAIPLGDDSVDIVVSFETIEHHDRHEEMMQQIKRVLRPGGLLIMSSPDKAQYSDIHGTENEFHVRELYRDEFEQLLARHFSNYSLQGQRIIYGSLLASETASHREFLSYRNDKDQLNRQPGVLEAIYLLAFASDSKLPLIPDSAYSTVSSPLVAQIHQLEQAAQDRGDFIRRTSAAIESCAEQLSQRAAARNEQGGMHAPSFDPEVISGLPEIPGDPEARALFVQSLTRLQDTLNGISAEQANKLATLTAQQDEQDKTLKALTTEIEALRATLESERSVHGELARQTEHLQHNITALRRSHSWRMTSPLRVSANLARASIGRARNLLQRRPGQATASTKSKQAPAATNGPGATSDPVQQPVLELARWLAPESNPNDGRPIVLILPGAFAVGGVERLTAAVIGQLHTQFRFVIVANEPHSDSSGCLLDSVTRYCHAQFDLAALADRSEHLTLLERICHALPPELVWIVNGSVWFHENIDPILQLFEAIPLIDHQVYDTEAGWINHLNHGYIEQVTRLVAVNARIRDKFLSMGVPAEKIDLIYSAIDLDGLNLKARDAQIDAGLPSPSGRKRVYALIARLGEQKRPLDFIEAAHRASQQRNDIEFLMVGDGPLAEQCRALIRKNGMDNITMMPFTNDLPAVYARVDAVVFVSAYEGLPLVMLEALSSGVPVISTDVGDVRLVAEELGGGCLIMEGAIENPQRISESILQFDDNVLMYQQQAQDKRHEMRRRFGAPTVSRQYFDCWVSAWQTHAQRDLAR